MSKTDPEFDKMLEEISSTYLNTWAWKQMENDPNYRQYERELNDTRRQIEECLGENRDLIQKFETAKNLAASRLDLPTYLQGFRDCILFLRKLEFL